MWRNWPLLNVEVQPRTLETKVQNEMKREVRLQILEQTFLAKWEAGKRNFATAGEALRGIREERLYKPEFSSFDDYCQKRWGFARAYADRMITSANEVDNLRSNWIENLPTNEGQARALAETKLQDKEKAAVWQEAEKLAGGKTPTSAHVREAAYNRTAGALPPAPIADTPRSVTAKGTRNPEPTGDHPAMKAKATLSGLDRAELLILREREDQLVGAISVIVACWESRLDTQESPGEFDARMDSKFSELKELALG